MLVEYLDKTRHVRAFEVVRQMHVHVESGDGVLHTDTLVFDLDRMADTFDADAIDRQVARISRTLHVGNKIWHGLIHGECPVELRMCEIITNPDKFSWRSEEHTSELQSLRHLVCRLL